MRCKEPLLFCVLQHPMDAETRNIPPGEQKIDKTFQWGSGATSGWEEEACTPPGALLRYFWGLFSISCLACDIYSGSDFM
jgi:hypothetical protein